MNSNDSLNGERGLPPYLDARARRRLLSFREWPAEQEPRAVAGRGTFGMLADVRPHDVGSPKVAAHGVCLLLCRWPSAFDIGNSYEFRYAYGTLGNLTHGFLISHRSSPMYWSEFLRIPLRLSHPWKPARRVSHFAPLLAYALVGILTNSATPMAPLET